MKLRVVIVEPLYPINLGYIARAADNFGVKKLYLVNPRCKPNSKQAMKYAKHSFSLLESAVICKSFESAVRNCFVVGTTALWYKTKDTFYNVYTASKLRKLLNNKSNVALVIGRDDTGLNKDELAKCDATIFIPASKKYPTLNISHALAILLYELTKASFEPEHNLERLYASPAELRVSKDLFKRFVYSKNYIRDKKAIYDAFAHILGRAYPTRKELKALGVAFSANQSRKKNQRLDA